LSVGLKEAGPGGGGGAGRGEGAICDFHIYDKTSALIAHSGPTYTRLLSQEITWPGPLT